MLQSCHDRLVKAIKELGRCIEMQGYEDGSTKWSVAFYIDKQFDIDKLNFDDRLKVKFFDLVEE
jgi:hypothetical protein